MTVHVEAVPMSTCCPLDQSRIPPAAAQDFRVRRKSPAAGPVLRPWHLGPDRPRLGLGGPAGARAVGVALRSAAGRFLKIRHHFILSISRRRPRLGQCFGWRRLLAPSPSPPRQKSSRMDFCKAGKGLPPPRDVTNTNDRDERPPGRRRQTEFGIPSHPFIP